MVGAGLETLSIKYVEGTPEDMSSMCDCKFRWTGSYRLDIRLRLTLFVGLETSYTDGGDCELRVSGL